MKTTILIGFLVLAGCGPSSTRTSSPTTPAHAADDNGSGAATTGAPAAARKQPATPTCSFVARRVSARGAGGMRPQLAASKDAFALAWEETTDHRAVRVQTFSPDAQPLGTAIEVADLARAGAAPRVAPSADGDGFAVFWAVEQGDGSALAMRRIDRTGKPKSDVTTVVVAPGVRPLDAVPTEKGWAVAWWNWSGTPHQVNVSFVDGNGRAVGKPLAITRSPAPDPTVDLAVGASIGRAASTVIAWDETVDDIEHVFVGDVGRDRLEGRADLGLGENPQMGAGVLVWERPKETAIYWAPLDGSKQPTRLVDDGHVPAAAPHGKDSAICWLRDTDPSEENHVDALTCGVLSDGKIVDATRVAIAPRGIFALQAVGGGGRIGVAWQTQDEGDTGVSFASLSCPAGAASAPK